MDDYFGFIGLLLILMGWIAELARAIRAKKAQVPLSFAILYGAGSLLLTLHSIQLSDAVFVALNGAAALIALANIGILLLHKGKG